MATVSASSWSSSLRMLGLHQDAKHASIERLSTGSRINRASDDPSGMMAVNDIKGVLAGITKKIDNFGRETARLGATEGGLSVLQDSLLHLQSIVVRAANGGGLGEGELGALGVEASGIVQGINLVAQTTMFDGHQVLLGNDAAGLASIQDGETTVTLNDIAGLLKSDPEKAQALVDAAVESVAGQRGAIGARLQAIESDIAVLQEEFAGNSAVLSQIQDTDYARETAGLVRAQILEQATIRTIQIEREQAARVLDLLSPGLSDSVAR